jgi:hypothetical protein
MACRGTALLLLRKDIFAYPLSFPILNKNRRQQLKRVMEEMKRGRLTMNKNVMENSWI